MKTVILGGVAAGMSAASKIKRVDPRVDVVVYEKRGFLSYGACGLPYYVGGFNDDFRRMIARTEETFHSMGVETHLHTEAIAADFPRREITLRDENGNEFKEKYDKLLIATGAESVVPPIPGREKVGVHVLKSLEDGIFLREVGFDPAVRNVVIVGGGAIGIECADAFLNLRKSVTLIEAADRVLTPFDPEFSEEAANELRRCGVTLRLSEKVQAFCGGDHVESVETDQGTYPADLVILSVGVRPSTGFLTDPRLKKARNGALIVDREMKTSITDVYAAGDCAVTYHSLTRGQTYLALGTVANKTGRIAGENLCGRHQKFLGVLGSAAIKVCDLEFGRTGLGEKEAMSLREPAASVIVEAYDHPAYYPDPTPIKIKVIFEKRTKRLLGAQLCGKKGAAIRTDVFAAAIQGGMRTDELGMTDLIYAPPFAGVWDAVQIACNAAK